MFEELTDRQKFLLTLVIHEYIRMAAPVGSSHLVERYHLEMSSATVRNELAALTERGYLRQPHTSAGRIPTEEGVKRVELLKQIKLPEVETTVEAVQDYRFCLRLRGEGLSGQVTETDPQAVGVPPLPVTALAPEGTRTARLLNDWVDQAREILRDQPPANMVTLRGPSTDPSLPKYADVFKLRAAAIAVYPMYRGVASLVGMDVLKPFPKNLDDELSMARARWGDYDFFFIHVKYTDSRGEDGNFEAKCKIIEEVDSRLPDLLALNPDVLVITGDHSTPALLRQHSWHPVPLLLWSKTCRPDGIARFGERPCAQGGLGHIPARHILPLALAHAGRLQKFGRVPVQTRLRGSARPVRS